MSTYTRLAELVTKNEASLLETWVAEQLQVVSKQGVLQPDELRSQCAEFLSNFVVALKSDQTVNSQSPTFDNLKELIASISKSRAFQGLFTE